MKKYRKRLLGLLFLTFVVSSAMIVFFDPPSPFTEEEPKAITAIASVDDKKIEATILESFSTGNAELLRSYFSEEVNLTILEEEDYYSRAETVSALQTFFEQNPPKSMQKKHGGISKHGDGEYLIALLSTSGGNKYRCYFFMDTRKITSIEIRKERTL